MNSLRGGGVESRHAAGPGKQAKAGRRLAGRYPDASSRSSDRPAPPHPDHIEDVLEMVSSETGASPGARRCPDLSAAHFDPPDDLDFAEGFRFKYGVDPLGVAADAH